MSVINTGKTFANGEQLTADKLNQVIDQATFNASEAVDGSTITLIGGAMAVNDSGITEAKIENGAVTKAKIENVTDMTVLGNTSGSDAAPQEVAILDEDTMSSNSATSLATQQSIKAYVDSLETNPVNLTLLNTAVPFDSTTYEVPSYYRTKDNIVHLRGLMKDSSSNPVATLPSGFRPAKGLLFSTVQASATINYGVGRVDIKANGDIELFAETAQYNSLDGISFLADGT